jgi:hypothetical protein
VYLVPLRGDGGCAGDGVGAGESELYKVIAAGVSGDTAVASTAAAAAAAAALAVTTEPAVVAAARIAAVAGGGGMAEVAAAVAGEALARFGLVQGDGAGVDDLLDDEHHKFPVNGGSAAAAGAVCALGGAAAGVDGSNGAAAAANGGGVAAAAVPRLAEMRSTSCLSLAERQQVDGVDVDVAGVQLLLSGLEGKELDYYAFARDTPKGGHQYAHENSPSA